jgi:hypothetical protein
MDYLLNSSELHVWPIVMYRQSLFLVCIWKVISSNHGQNTDSFRGFLQSPKVNARIASWNRSCPPPIHSLNLSTYYQPLRSLKFILHLQLIELRKYLRQIHPSIYHTSLISVLLTYLVKMFQNLGAAIRNRISTFIHCENWVQWWCIF